MKALLQRVIRSSVSANGEKIGEIKQGLVVFAGVASRDTQKDAQYLAEKIVGLRIFSDTEGKFNLSVLDIHGEVLIVSQFTLLAETRKGRRPSFTNAATPQQAEELIDYLEQLIRNTGLVVQTGRFRAHMLVEIQNDGPVTIMLDSHDKFASG